MEKPKKTKSELKAETTKNKVNQNSNVNKLVRVTAVKVLESKQTNAPAHNPLRSHTLKSNRPTKASRPLHKKPKAGHKLEFTNDWSTLSQKPEAGEERQSQGLRAVNRTRSLQPRELSHKQETLRTKGGLFFASKQGRHAGGGKNETAVYRPREAAVTKKVKPTLWIPTPAHQRRLKIFIQWVKGLSANSSKNKVARAEFAGLERKNLNKNKTAAAVTSILSKTTRGPNDKNITKTRESLLVHKSKTFFARVERKRIIKTSPLNTGKGSSLLKQFMRLLQQYTNTECIKQESEWAEQESRRLARWYAINYQPYQTKRTSLTEQFYAKTAELRKFGGPEKRLLKVIRQKALLVSMKHGASAKDEKHKRVLGRLGAVRSKLIRWYKRYQQNKKAQLFNILGTLGVGRSRFKGSDQERRVLYLMWLFLSPALKAKQAKQPRQLRTTTANRRRNRWRKTVPPIHKKEEQITRYALAKRKVLSNLKRARPLADDEFDAETFQSIEKLRAQLRPRRAGHAAMPVRRKLLWRRRRRKSVKKVVRKYFHKMCLERKKEVEKPAQVTINAMRKLKLKLTTITPFQQRTTLNTIKKMTTNFSRFYSTKIHTETPVNKWKPERKKGRVKQRQQRNHWLRTFQLDLKRKESRKLKNKVQLTTTRPTPVVLPVVKRLEHEWRKPASGLKSTRLRRKLKKLGPVKQSQLFQNRRPLIRRFITTRMLFNNAKKPAAASVRKTEKLQMLKRLAANTRTVNQQRGRLYQARLNPRNAANLTQDKEKIQCTERAAVNKLYAARQTKFTKHWQFLARQTRNKKQSWRTLLQKRPEAKLKQLFRQLRSGEKKKSGYVLKQSIKNQPTPQFKQKAQTRALKERALSKSLRALRYVRKQRLARLLTRSHAARQRRLRKTRGVTSNMLVHLATVRSEALNGAVKTLRGTGLKKWRREQKHLLRIRTKKSIKRKRKQWFKKAIARARRQRRPQYLKPWEPGPARPVVIEWARQAAKKTTTRYSLKVLPLPRFKKGSNRFSAHLQRLTRKKQASQLTPKKRMLSKQLKAWVERISETLKNKTNTKPQRSTELRNARKTHALRESYFTVTYRLRARLQSRKSRRGVSRWEQKSRKAVNRRRWSAALKVQQERRAVNLPSKKCLKMFKIPAVMTRAERQKRHMSSLKRRQGKDKLQKNRNSSHPSAVGIKRSRRVLTTKKSKLLLFHKTARQLLKRSATRDKAVQAAVTFRKKTVRLAKPSIKSNANKNVQAKTAETSGLEIAKDRNRMRLPGTGRSKNTFDALLRKQYSKRTPALYKDKSSRNTKQASRLATAKRRQLAHFVETRVGSRRSSAQAKRVTAASYISLTERQQIAKGSASNVATSGKFLLAKSSVRAKATVKNLYPSARTNAAVHLGTVEMMLRAALTKYRSTRRAKNLRKLGRKTRITKMKIRPFWLQRKHAKKMQRARVAMLYPLGEDSRFGRPVVDKWALNELGLSFSRRRGRKPLLETARGESLVVKPVVRRATPVVYLQKELKKRKRTSLKSRSGQVCHGVARLKKKRVHRAARRLKEILSRFRYHKRKALKKLNIWKLRKRYRLEGRSKNRLKKRLKYGRTLKQLTSKAVSTLLEKVTTEKEKLEAEGALKHARVLVTPLHFKRPIYESTSVAEENKKWQQHVRAARKQQYRRLGETADALTQLTPSLISMLLNKKELTKEQGKKAIKAMYWNLRLALQQAYRNKNEGLLERYSKRLRHVKKELIAKAESRFFQDSDVKETRYRFQPYKLTKAPSLQRGTHNWIWQFLPKFYDLFLEDPEKYGHLMITPIKVFRSHLNAAAMKKWETRVNPSTMEAQFKRLTRGRHGRSSNRFENMLMTARRRPVVNGYGAATESQVISTVGTTAPKTSFFTRSFSTSTKSALVSTRLMNELGQLQADSKNRLDAVLLKSYKGVKERVVAKAEAKHVSEHALETAGAVDTRLGRRKSPRSGEFLERLTQREQLSFEKTLTKYRAYTKQHKVAVNNASRSKRRTKAVKDESRGSLRKVRQEQVERRTPIFVKNQKLLLEKKFNTTQQMRLQGPWAVDITSHFTWKVKADKIARRQALRNVLTLQRSTSAQYQTGLDATPVLPVSAVQIKRSLRNRARKYSLNKRIVKRLGLKRWKAKAVSFKKQILRRKPSGRKGASSNTYKTKVNSLSVGAIKSRTLLPRVLYSTARSRKTTRGLVNPQFKLREAKNYEKNITANFVKTPQGARAVKKKISAAAVKEAVHKNVSLWAVRRQELWHQLTHKWMKRRRILRRWLKGVKYSLKSKTHWTFEGEHVIPDELFKLSRIRLRKLEWRKSDGRFEYDGLKKKLTLRPEEKRVAPWLEGLLYSRALYSTQRLAIRRYQLPKDLKSKKWIQKAKKQLFRKRATHLYLKRRHWPRLRMYNQRLHRSLFRIRNTKSTVKRFQKLNRRKPKGTGFEVFAKGHMDRVDVNLMLLNFAPTTYWARAMTKIGLIKINGKPVTKPDARLSPGDRFTWDKGLLAVLREYFQSPLKKWERDDRLVSSSLRFPRNFEYNPQLNVATYVRHPRLNDIELSGRVNSCFFKWFRLDGRLGK